METRSAPRNTPHDLYEIKHTGDYNYRIEGGGEKFWADGIEGKTVVLEAKKIVNPERSPFIPISRIDVRLREIIIESLLRDLHIPGEVVVKD